METLIKVISLIIGMIICLVLSAIPVIFIIWVVKMIKNTKKH